MDIENKMKLTIINRLRLCWEILTIKSGHAHTAQEKQLSTFQRGYAAGLLDSKLERISKKQYDQHIDLMRIPILF